MLTRQRFSISSLPLSLPAQLDRREQDQVATTIHVLTPPAVEEGLVCSLLQGLNPHKSMDPEEIHPGVLRQVAAIGARPLSIISENSWRCPHKKEVFYAENNQTLQQPPQGCDGVSITGGFQDATGESARQSHLGSLSHRRLDWMVFQGPFRPGLVYDKDGCAEGFNC